MISDGIIIYFAGKKDNENDAKNGEFEKTTTGANQFHFIERATQSKINDVQETSCQTDPPPM